MQLDVQAITGDLMKASIAIIGCLASYQLYNGCYQQCNILYNSILYATLASRKLYLPL